MKINPATAFNNMRLPYPNRGIIGHRGLSADAPENTRASFMAAANAGLSWVEFDIQRCASGEWVVFHDETLDRTSNGRGAIRNTAFSELKNLDIGSWFHPRFSNERILSLAETLPLLAHLRLHPNIEVKFFETDMETDVIQLAAEIGPIVERYWPHQAKTPAMISSFHLDFLTVFRQLYRDCPLGYLVDTFNEEQLILAEERGFNTLNVNKESLLTYFDLKAQERAIPILAYTVDDTPTAERLFSDGISAIFSDKANIFR